MPFQMIPKPHYSLVTTLNKHPKIYNQISVFKSKEAKSN